MDNRTYIIKEYHFDTAITMAMYIVKVKTL